MMVFGLVANAETTDVSNIDNVLYINNVSAEAGGQATLSVRMKNKANVQTVGVFVKLPEGVTVATNDRGQYQASLSNERTGTNSHALSKSCVDGVYRVGILGTAGVPFTGTDGEVFTMTVNVPTGMLDGDYTIEMTKIELTDTNNRSYKTESVKSTLTVSSVATGINNATAADDSKSIYGIGGQSQQTLNRGVNIVTSNNGVRKIVKK